ncbi:MULTISPECIES: DUF7535 family protein [Salinibaculum]|uniref:DUF7535 family protein n=1 Tax=Salinibaculum TaxID=2732368 RepID=UPI0030CC632C
MATEESPPGLEPVQKVYRTVTPPYRGRSNQQMNLVGYLIIGGMLILFVPLAPFIIAWWLVAKLLGAIRQRAE